MSLAGDVLPVGDAAVLAVVGDTIDAATSASVWSLYAALQQAFGKSVLDIVPAYGSVLVRFNPAATQAAIVMATIRGAMEHAQPVAQTPSRNVEIGVCFAPEHALDLTDVAQRTGLKPDDVVSEFCRPTYRVAFLGFSAGFPYLIGLSDKLDLPRLPAPRVRVPAGSVAFAAGQCGIYPRTLPGGWRILGKTGAKIFDPTSAEPALLRAGDAVRFRAVATVDDATAVIA